MKRISLIGLLSLCWLANLSAVGTATWRTPRLVMNQVGVYARTITWASDASGNVNGTVQAIGGGQLLQVQFVPDTGGTAPDNLYDAVLIDERGQDVLGTLGANLSGTAPVMVDKIDHWLDRSATLELRITGAGATNGGIILVYLRRL